MKESDLSTLKINQTVKVKCKESKNGYYISTIKSINDWTKQVGVIDTKNMYKEYPIRLISKIEGFTKDAKVTYIGKGFLGFDENDTTMTIVKKSDRWENQWIVTYKNFDMLVGTHEIK